METTDQSEADQDEAIAFLSSALAHSGSVPVRHETHISVVFLVGTEAWKLKKAIQLPFLDHRSLEARRNACEAEVRLNQRIAPRLYRGVVALTRESDGALVVGGQGTPVEWLVRMRRFGEGALLSERLAAGKIGRRDIQAVAEAVWDLHREAPVCRQFGGKAALDALVALNARSFAALDPLLPVDMCNEVLKSWQASVVRLGGLADKRREQGLVRHCHGDLHCGNICWFEDRPIPFDAIEFSDDIACIDVFYDLAFLLMDLAYQDSKALACYAMNHSLDLSGDFSAIGLLPLFLSLRAGIRAFVTAQMAEGRDAFIKRSRSYLEMALTSLTPPVPRLIGVGGLSGSGKSRLARELAPLLATPGAVVVRSDSMRKRMLGVSLLDRLGEEGYTPEITARTYEAVYRTCAEILQVGHPVVVDAVFGREEERDTIERVAQKAGVPFHGLWLEVPPDLAATRITERVGNVSDATPEVLQRQTTWDLGILRWHKINSGGTKNETLQYGRLALGLDASSE